MSTMAAMDDAISQAGAPRRLCASVAGSRPRRPFSRLIISGLLLFALFATAGAEAGLVTSYELESTDSSSQAAVPVTFGQVFKSGDVPAGSDLVVRGGAGEPLLSQVDRKALHPDGSLRHAIVTTVVPVVSGASQQTLALETQAGTSGGAAVSLSGLLASGFDAQVELAVGGTGYTLSARDLLSSGSYETWLSGPLVSEWIVGGPVRKADGTEHPRLAAYFHVRAYAGYERVRVDVVVENGWAFVSGASDQSYSIDVRLNGASVYQQSINHYNHARWHKQFWAGQQPNVYIRHDVDYLQATGAIPSYIDLTPSEAYLNGLAQSSTPMDNGELTDNFGDTGAQPQIGPLPRWTSTYAVSGDRRAFRNMLANDDSAGTYAAHYRDKQTGRPVSIVDHPNATLQDNSVPQGSSSNPYRLDQAHQPSVGFLSYVVTGDYFYLEETQFWTSWNLLWTNSGYRGYEKGIFTVQVRGQAWALRNLGQAAYITPDDSPLKSHYASHIYHNAQSRIDDYVNGSSNNNLGAIKSYDGASLFAPWMDDFFSWAVGYLVDLGFTEVIPLRDWKVRFPVGRMGLTDYCYLRAAEYRLVIGPSNNVFWSSFAELYSQNFGAVGDCPEGAEMGGYAHSPTGYTSNLRPALVAAVNAGIPGAQTAWERFLNSAVHPDFSDYPNWGLVPAAGALQDSPDEPDEPAVHPLENLPAGHWVEVENTKLERVFPDPWPPGATGPRAVMAAWSGGAFDTNRDRLVVWGGGHGDYSGNELYVFDVNTLAWARLTEPSTDVGGDEASGLYPDGRPRSRHTYATLGYAPNVDKFVNFGAPGTYPSHTIGDSRTHLFDFGTNEWSQGQVSGDVGSRYGSTAYDPVSGKLFFFGGSGGGRFASYDPIEDRFAYHSSYSATIYTNAAIDPGRRNMVVVGGYGGTPQLFKLDLDNPDAAPVNLLPMSTGDTFLEISGGVGFVFDPVADKFVGWHGGANVYTLDPDTWVWERIAPASGNATVPTAAESNGTYGRFQYIPSRNAFIAVNRTNENVYLYRLSDPPPPPEEIIQEFTSNNAGGGGGGASWSLLILSLLSLARSRISR